MNNLLDSFDGYVPKYRDIWDKKNHREDLPYYKEWFRINSHRLLFPEELYYRSYNIFDHFNSENPNSIHHESRIFSYNQIEFFKGNDRIIILFSSDFHQITIENNYPIGFGIFKFNTYKYVVLRKERVGKWQVIKNNDPNCSLSLECSLEKYELYDYLVECFKNLVGQYE